MDDQQNTTSLDRLAGALVRWAGSGTLIIDHMTRWAAHRPVEGSAADALTRVVRTTLASLEHRHAAADLAVAAAVLDDAVEELANEILLVDPESIDPDEEWAEEPM